MALAVSVGFVVDDAIVMIENAFRHLEKGATPFRAAADGAQQIGFTVISISVSLVAAFIPLLFMGGVAGRLFREFSVTLVFAIVISTLVSLSVTPMICAHYVRAAPSTDATWFDRLIEGALAAMARAYGRSLAVVIRHRVLTLLGLVLTIALTVYLYVHTPKGFFPQDDFGFIGGVSVASTDISFRTMIELQQRARQRDPVRPGRLRARLFGRRHHLERPRQQRPGVHLAQAARRARRRVDPGRGRAHARQARGHSRRAGLHVAGAAAARTSSGRQSRSQYQFTLIDADTEELARWVPRVQDRLRHIPGIIDVTTDREQGGLQADVMIDRTAASRLGVRVQDIDNTLNNAFSQRQVSTIFTQRNQYRVILEVDADHQREPSDLRQVYVAGAGGTQVPLSAVARITKSNTPLSVNHQSQYPAVTITYNLAPDMALETAATAVNAGGRRDASAGHAAHRLRRRHEGVRGERRLRGGADHRRADRHLYRARRAL